MRTLFNQPNVSKYDLVNFPSGRIKDNSGVGDGTGVNEATKGDLHQMLEKLMRLYAITPNELPDSEGNGFQLIEALRGLASKNDFIYPMSTNGTVVSVDIKFSQMLENEFIVCRASFDKGTETQIKGLGATLFTIAYSGSFKTNEYVRVIKTSSGISIVRLSDALSLDAMVSDFLYLKKASQTEENAGEIDTVSTTPLSNLVAFTKRVIGSDSGSFLATAIRNGLYPKEHFTIVAGIGLNRVRNEGSIKGIDVNGVSVGTSLPVDGDITSAVVFGISGQDDETFILVTMTNAIDSGKEYLVRVFPESQGNLKFDNDYCGISFKPISQTTFQLTIREVSSSTQNLRLHLEVVQKK